MTIVEKDPDSEIEKPAPEEKEEEFKHQKVEANPEKFERKSRVKRNVEDIFALQGSKQKRDEYISKSTQEHIDKRKKKSWMEAFGIVKDDPNSQEIMLLLGLICVFFGVLMTLLCCICIYWWQDR